MKALLILLAAGCCYAADVALPPAPSGAGVDLVSALKSRRSVREFAPTPLSKDDLGAVLWAACGVNRPNGKRTAPSQRGTNLVQVYAAGEDGVYRYDAQTHTLVQVTGTNVKGKLSRSAFVATAQWVLLLIADPTKGTRDGAYATSGFIGENVYLMAAARNLGTVYMTTLNEPVIREALTLRAEEIPLAIMPLGTPK